MIQNKEVVGMSSKAANKVVFAEKIIQFFLPFFSDEIEEKEKQYQQSKKDYESVKEKAENSTTELKEIQSELNRQKLINSILQKIDVLRKYDMLYGSNRRVSSEIIGSIEEANMNELKDYQKKVKELVQKSLKTNDK